MSPRASWPGPRERLSRRARVIRQRHVPLLCGSCQGPLSRQELRCWRCGARVGRSRSSRRGGSSRRQRPRRGPHRGLRTTGASAATRSLRRGSARRRAIVVPPTRTNGAGPSRARTTPAGSANVPRPGAAHQTNDAGARCHDRCRRRRLRPAPPAPRGLRQRPRSGTRQAVTATSPRPRGRGRRHEALGHPPARGAVPAHPRGSCGLRYGTSTRWARSTRRLE